MAENKSDDPYNSHESRTEELLFTISHLRPYFPKEFECIKKAEADADASSQNNEEFISKLIEYGEQDEQCEDITIMNWLKNKKNPPTLTENNIRKVVVYAIRFHNLDKQAILEMCKKILPVSPSQLVPVPVSQSQSLVPGELKDKTSNEILNVPFNVDANTAAAAAGGGSSETNEIILKMLNVELKFFLPTGMNKKNGGEKDTGLLKCLLQKR